MQQVRVISSAIKLFENKKLHVILTTLAIAFVFNLKKNVSTLKFSSTLPDILIRQIVDTFIAIGIAFALYLIFTKNNKESKIQYQKALQIKYLFGGILFGGLCFLNLAIRKFSQLSTLDIWVLLIISIFTAIREELVFRNIFQTKFLKKYDVFNSTLFSAIIFGVFHVATYLGGEESLALVFLNSTLMGIMLSYAQNTTKGIGLSIGIHFSWDFFGPPTGLNVMVVVILFYIFITMQNRNNLDPTQQE